MALASDYEVVINAEGVPVAVKKGEKVSQASPSASAASSNENVRDHAKTREKTRLTKESGDRADGSTGLIGGAFTAAENPSWLKDRADVYDEIISQQKARLASKPRQPINITLPDGKVLTGTSWETTPMSIAEGISKGLAQNVVVAKVAYTGPRLGVEEADGLGVVNTGPEDEEEGTGAAKAELWDLYRPLEGDCNLQLLKFDDKEGKMVFWHSSAHVLGECLECKYGAKLCIGPPTEDGFYYDAYMGNNSIEESKYEEIKKKAEDVCKQKQTFERIVLSKEQALRLFSDNPFKVQLIQTKIPDGGYTTAYRCGPLIDLCRGPHVPNTGAIKAFEITKNSSAYWLGNADNDSLQRVYGISFPDSKQMKSYLTMVEEAKKRDHRVLGQKQELFFFHELSPGSCFFLPHGAHIYNKLMAHIRSQYDKRGFHEVVTPNMFNLDLWRISGHADHYLENMFTFKVEGQDFGLKPMNCPGHCLMFDHRVRSYRELPMRVADFGVLHRNEFSGALTGLTRVRRFQQDDAHIFCRMDQIKEEVAGALEFMLHTYGVFGFTFELDLSTRPKKALGSLELWNKAETMMKEALDKFGRPWKINPGDGAFYGPKIDIKVFDALGRRHQCATIQLDFQLPIRFNLRYKARTEADAKAEAEAVEEEKPAAGEKAAESAESSATGLADGDKKGKKEMPKTKKERRLSIAEAPGAEALSTAPPLPPKSQVQLMVDSARAGVDELPEGFERPVIIHRAILGSVERFMAVLIEHTGGKWPFWLSPRQIAIVPVANKYLPYSMKVQDALRACNMVVDVDASTHTLNKKVREAQVSQYNFILVLGAKEEESGSVNIRTRDNQVLGEMKLDEAIEMFKKLVADYQ